MKHKGYAYHQFHLDIVLVGTNTLPRYKSGRQTKSPNSWGLKKKKERKKSLDNEDY